MTLYKRALFKRFKDKYAPDEVDKLALLIIVAFLTIFSVMGCIEAYASEREEVEILTANNLSISSDRNYFAYQSGSNLAYVEIEPGYVYYFENILDNYDVFCCFSNDAPAVNVVYDNPFRVTRQSTYSFIGNGDYLYFDFQHNVNFKVYREKLNSYEGAVNDLVDNVGTQQIWDIFGNGIDFIYVVIIVAFGIFLVVLAIRKVSKGKSEF